jgi:hypothetical protein
MSHMTHDTCRFCDNRDQAMVKYGTRHNAHFKCYLDAGKSLDDLHAWQVRQFPYFLLKERGLLAVAAEIDEKARKAGDEIERLCNRLKSFEEVDALRKGALPSDEFDVTRSQLIIEQSK